MKKTILEKVADNKFNAVKQLVRFIRENDKNPGGFEDLWENSFALEDELDEIILRIAHIIELEKALEDYEELGLGLRKRGLFPFCISQKRQRLLWR